MTSALDTTTIAKVQNWISPSTTFSATEQQNIQDTITAWGLELLRLTGRGDQSNDVPATSPFNQPVSYTETYDGNGSDKMFLRNWPIQSVSSLVIGYNTITESTSFGQAGFVIDSTAKALVLRNGSTQGTYNNPTYFFGLGGYRFYQGRQNVVVAYEAGFLARAISAELDTIPATGTPAITVQVLPWLSDSGVSYFSNGNPLTKVLFAPAAGQYFVQNGVYLFNAADAGKQVLINYSSAGTPFDLQQASTRIVALTYKQRNAIGQRSQSMANGAGTVNYDWQIDDKDWQVIEIYRRRAMV